MKINVTKKALGAALDQLARVVPLKSTNANISAIRLVPADQSLTLEGTNLEVDLRLHIDCEVGLMDERFPFMVPCHLFHQAVKKAGGELIELVVANHIVTIHSGGGKSEIQLKDPESWPGMKYAPPKFEVNAADLWKSFEATLYAYSTEAFQAVFRGVMVRFGKEPVVVASDGYRVATRAFACDVSENPMIIPGRSIPHLATLLAGVETAGLAISEGLATFSTKRGTLNVKLLDGDFPDWERVVPKDIKLTAKVSKAKLQEALDRASLFIDSDRNNRVELTFVDNTLRIESANEYGRFNERMETEQGGSEPALAMAVNLKHLLDSVKVTTGDVIFSASGSSTPFKITCEGDPNVMGVAVTLKV